MNVLRVVFMGLDAVELVMRVEDRFSVRLSDADCTRVGTIADLAALVISKLPKSPTACVTARTFYKLRSHMVAQCGIERRQVRPSARIGDLIPTGLAHTWRRLRLTDAAIPALVVSPVLDLAMLVLTGILVSMGFLFSGVLVREMGVVIALVTWVVAIALLVAANKLTTGVLAHCLPFDISTVGDMVRCITPIEFPLNAPGKGLIVQQHVLAEIRKITATQLGMPIEQVRAESHLIHDLKMD